MRLGIVLAALAALAGCALAVPRVVPQVEPSQAQFYGRLRALCGQAFEGRVVTGDAADREMAAARLVVQVRSCSDSQLAIPFHVGADHGRIWVIGRTAAGLSLRHEHRAPDGSAGSPTDYGGETIAPGNPRRQEFPADRATRDMFVRANLAASITNVWAIEIVPGRMLAYELRRPGRYLRIEFDLTRPAAAPPPPWGER
ncbi:MAG: hypothetical protein QOJ53_193 [Sphingomonadales bacterium]|jgi:hypothetical protein|nr:hypothetical protein [Sphingomonadales bacterium]MEA3044880.1 hypothetical protein [Sphingomonadales bacterium]MEA3045861.1 hypothetical protein [Sphingomonadales bacterium]